MTDLTPMPMLPVQRMMMPAHCFHPNGKRRLWRTILRFLNVCEPGPEIVLSPTRIGMWVIVFVVPYLAITSPGNIAATLSSLAAAAPFVINFVHQRMCDSKTGGNPNESGANTTQ